MGLLDDLAMGFGFKERTKDYDARTARNIARSQAAGNWGGTRGYSMSPQAMMAEAKVSDKSIERELSRQGDRRNPSQARIFLDTAGRAGGYDAGTYNPVPAKDDRSFFQRAIFSPESSPSPRPYAIGPLTMDQPLPAFGIMGLIKALAGGGKKKQAAPMSTFDSTYSMGGLIPRTTPAPVVDDGQITEEEIADVTGEPTAGNEFEGMSATEIKDALMAKFNETGEDPTLDYTEDLFSGDDVYVNYLNTRPIADKITAYANRLAGR